MNLSGFLKGAAWTESKKSLKSNKKEEKNSFYIGKENWKG